MSAQWTVERLDALPEGTVVEYQIDPSIYGDPDIAVRIDDSRFAWHGIGAGEAMYHEDLLIAAQARSIRVVSVPIDALLADETKLRVGEALGIRVTPIVVGGKAVRAAVAHVTGEQS